MEEVSKRLFQQLDCTGYSYDMIEHRRTHYRSVPGNLYSTRLKGKVVISGSKGDGMAKRFESDEDILYFMNNIVCVEDPASEHLLPAHDTVFTTVKKKPGYCMLELLREGPELCLVIANSLVPFNEKTMLSSQTLGAEFFSSTSTANTTRTGPAQTDTLNIGITRDFVPTFPCLCESILEDFVNRPRTHDWPPSSLRQSILQMSGNLVATGADDSDTKHLEWRYCFNEIEILIMATLNDTQRKLFKLLKIVNNDILKPIGLALTSFILKNILFWLAETNSQSTFLPETLWHWLCETLVLLKQYVVANKIPYYMISDRDLLKEKVKESDRPKLIQIITDIIVSGPAKLYECVTINKYRDLAPYELSVLKYKLEALELCALGCDHTAYQEKDPDSDPLYQMLCCTLGNILRCGWPPQVQQLIDECENVFDAYKMLLC